MISFFLDVIVMDIKYFFFLDMIAINEMKENNYDANVLWKGNIAYLWVL
jgi:hypothetical protein